MSRKVGPSRTIDPLEGMTQKRWESLSSAERLAIRDYSGLSPQLIGLEGWRVEVTDSYGETRRFIVGKSTGWRPCHLEIKTRRSLGGGPADKTYARISRIRKER